MLVGTVLYNPATRNPSKFTNHLIAKAMNSLLHLQVESKNLIVGLSPQKPGNPLNET